MRLDHAPEVAVPAVVLAGDEITAAGQAGGGRRLRVLDFLVGAVLALGGVAVLANALVLQGTRPFALFPPASPVAAEAPAEGKARPVKTTSIPLPRANPAVPHGSRGSAIVGATDGTLGYLAVKTQVSGMPTPLLPVSADEAAAVAIASPRPVAGQRPPLDVGAASEVTGAVRPPAEVPVSARSLAVQRALARLGYGPLKVDGVAGSETRLAIQRFQRDRKLAPDGEMSDRLLRELSAVSGLALN